MKGKPQKKLSGHGSLTKAGRVREFTIKSKAAKSFDRVTPIPRIRLRKAYRKRVILHRMAPRVV